MLEAENFRQFIFFPRGISPGCQWSFAHNCSESILLLVCEQGIHTLRKRKLKPRIDVNIEVATDFLPQLSFSLQSQRGHTWLGLGLGRPVSALFPLLCSLARVLENQGFPSGIEKQCLQECLGNPGKEQEHKRP